MIRKQVAVVTLHRKSDQIAPAFREISGFELQEIRIDTDLFGTFAGDIERRLPPKENAIAKARKGIEISGISRAIASEGSIGPDPMVPFVISDHEVMVYLDEEEELVISESYRSFEIVAITEEVSLDTPIEPILLKADFPRHKVILTAVGDSGTSIIKDLATIDEIRSGIKELVIRGSDGRVTIESDLRAHCSPSRQKNIEEVAKLLAKRVATLCPACRRRGFGRIDYERGVPCSECHRINSEVASRVIDGCDGCGHQESGEVLREVIEAAQCQYCNP
jgi:hypothetical protein